MDGRIASFTLQKLWLNAVWALHFVLCCCLIDCINVAMMNKISITMERNGLERRSGTFLTKANVRVIDILCKHAVNHKRSVSFVYFRCTFCGRKIQLYILFLICDELFNAYVSYPYNQSNFQSNNWRSRVVLRKKPAVAQIFKKFATLLERVLSFRYL